jgi:hypothetical protein
VFFSPETLLEDDEEANRDVLEDEEAGIFLEEGFSVEESFVLPGDDVFVDEEDDTSFVLISLSVPLEMLDRVPIMDDIILSSSFFSAQSTNQEPFLCSGDPNNDNILSLRSCRLFVQTSPSRN